MLRTLVAFVLAAARPRPRRRSNIPTIRCACWSALPPAAGPTSRRAPSRSSSPPSLRQSFYRREPARRQRHHRGARGRAGARRTATRCCSPARRSRRRRYIYKNLGYDTLDRSARRSRPSAPRRHVHAGRRASRRSRRVPEFIDHAKNEPRAVRLARRRQRPASRRRDVRAARPASRMQHMPYKGASEVMTGAARRQRPDDVRHAAVGDGPGQGGHACARWPSPAPSRSRHSRTCR